MLLSYHLIDIIKTPFLNQKASASSAATVSEYVGYLEKGQIPPKVLHDECKFELVIYFYYVAND